MLGGLAKPAGSKSPDSLAILGATLIDGTGAAPLEKSAVVIQDGQISWVGPMTDLDPEPGLHRIDGAGKYVIPGLMDANVHLVLHIDPDILLRYAPGHYDDLVIEAAQVALRAGITTIFDTWGPLESLRRVRGRINSGEVVGSRILFAGNIIGNGGPWSEDFWPTYGELANPAVARSINRQWEQGVGADLTWMPVDNVRQAVRTYIATTDVDFVKYASSSHRWHRFINFSPDVQGAIVEEAHAAGLTAQACTLTPEALKLAIAAGVDILQHGNLTGRYPMPIETLGLIVERQIPCVALLQTARHMAAVQADSQTSEYRRLLEVVGDENSRRLIRAGAKILLATDGGVFAPNVKTSPWLGPQFAHPDVSFLLGRSHLLWLQAAREHQMSPMACLLSATRNIAEAYGKGDELGTIERGKRGDLLVLEGNPLDSVENYGRIVHVIKDGELVDRERLPEKPVLQCDA